MAFYDQDCEIALHCEGDLHIWYVEYTLEHCEYFIFAGETQIGLENHQIIDFQIFNDDTIELETIDQHKTIHRFLYYEKTNEYICILDEDSEITQREQEEWVHYPFVYLNDFGAF